MSDFFHGIADYFSTINVVEEKQVITITGVRTAPLFSDIANRWSTGKITANMFKTVRMRALAFDSFFAVEVLYVLKALVATKRTKTSRAVLTEMIVKLENNTWLKRMGESAPQIYDRKRLDLFNVTPLPHQSDFFAHYEQMTHRMRLDGYLLAAGVGSGKTLSQLMISEMLNPDIIIIVSPIKAVKEVWEKSLKTFYRETPKHWHSLSGEKATGKERYFVVHFEALGPFFKWLQEQNFKGKTAYIGLDESHNFNELKSLRTEIFIEMCKYFKKSTVDIIWASGTPLKAMGAEVIPLFRCIDPFFTRHVEDRFRKIFGLSTSRGIDILANRIGLVMFKVDSSVAFDATYDAHRIDISIPDGDRFTLKEIRKVMQAFIAERAAYYKKEAPNYHRKFKAALEHYEYTLNFSQLKEFKLYLDYVEDMHRGYDPVLHAEPAAFCNRYEKRNIMPRLEGEMRKDFQESRAVYKYVNLKIQGEALGRILGREREACNVAMLQAIDKYQITELFGDKEVYDSSLGEIIATSDSKTLIFTSYVDVVKELSNILKKRNYIPLQVFGETNKELSTIMETYRSNKKADPLIATYKSLGDAVPVTEASTVIFLNSPFRHHEYEQALARVKRKGQEQRVRAFDVYLNTGNEPNISTRSIDIMEWSKAQVEAMMGIKGGPALESILEDYDPESQIGESVIPKEPITWMEGRAGHGTESFKTGASWNNW